MTQPTPHVARARRRGLYLVTALLALATLAGCGAPATLKERGGYWADQSANAQAYNHRVRFLVIHYTGGDTQRAFNVLTGPNVSTHYLVTPQPPRQSGEPVVYQLVPEAERAWQAGVSHWNGREQINDTSIGIEIVNQGPVDTNRLVQWYPFADGQIDAVIALARDIVARYDIAPANVVGHSDIAPGRKIDPGPLFPWQRLHAAGVGAWPDANLVAQYQRRFVTNPPSLYQTQVKLAHYGYDISATGTMDAQTKRVLRAFQMHFRPSDYNGYLDAETQARLWALDDQYR
ncbi:N-acetylmuramoyl-L-alanine amidase [Salinisphaera japonica]|uniref:N-acetylmuramoyl-L-alanine amidase n=1 Tax=Salinisphaera japonica YTM-1 TaxID=1209778 RepID=A0A423PLW5_9GAMM|nr:N-acetylmuramoyl-L-alanine amidase [Salinisphaera japonica]ROO26614.1 nucleoside transporter [Salinisphaera japonica YTM-1]